jgi:hypothetical protein
LRRLFPEFSQTLHENVADRDEKDAGKVAIVMPNTTTVPMTPRDAAPDPFASLNGTQPRMNANDTILARLDAAREPIRLVICNLSTSTNIDPAGARMFLALHAELAKRGIALGLVEARSAVREGFYGRSSPDFASDWCVTFSTIWLGNSRTVSPGQRLQRGQEILPSQIKGRPWADFKSALEEKSHRPVSQHLRTTIESSHPFLNPAICRQDRKLRMSSPTRYFNHSLSYPMLVKPRKSCYCPFLRLKSYPEITSPTENYEQTPQIR